MCSYMLNQLWVLAEYSDSFYIVESNDDED